MNYYNIIRLIIFIIPVLGLAGDGSFPHLSGENLGVIWVVPFVGILLSIAIFPLVAPHFYGISLRPPEDVDSAGRSWLLPRISEPAQGSASER